MTLKCQRSISLLLLLCLALAGRPARGDDPPADGPAVAAREFIDRGVQLYQQKDYDGAIQAFESAYRLVQKPLLLFDIGQAHRKAGRPDLALPYYRQFVVADPHSPQRAETEGYIEDIVSAQRKARESEQKRLQAAQALQQPLPQRQPAPQRPQKVPLYRKAWLWGLVAGLAAATAAGVGTGVYFGTRDPHTDVGSRNVSF